MSERKRVVFATEWMPTYRAGFYEELRPRLNAMSIDMSVVHGSPPGSRKLRGDGVSPDWATHVDNKMTTIGGIEVTWQPVLRHLKGADLIVVQHEAALPLNYLLLARRKLGGPKIAFWGHGEHFNPLEANRAAEAMKTRVIRHADWFFAYTERSARIVESHGLPANRITTVNNSRSSDACVATNPSPEIAALVDEVECRTAHIGWMVSALDQWKRVPFLIETLDQVRRSLPTFEFFLLGSGEALPIAEKAAASRPWLHVLGPTFAGDKRRIGEAAKLTIHPGLIGLHVIDSFAFETPIVTTHYEAHSHEFDYLDHEQNAIICGAESSPADVARAVSDVFERPDLLVRLQAGCRASAQAYGVDHMADRFSEGVRRALEV